MNKTALRNVLVVLLIAALVVLLPGGGTGAQIATQAVSLAFLGALGWFASITYRQHRTTLYGLGARRRAILYGAVALAAVVLTASSRLWNTGTGIIVWFALIGAAAYAVFAVIWSARQY
jgi:hypothetical protein